jgi:uncharacterized protein YjiS (DUF1127 family)
MTTITCTNTPIVKPTAAPFAWLRYAITIKRERNALSKLDASQLADIGLDYTVARTEASRPFWDLPTH